MLKCYEITAWEGEGRTAEGAIPDRVPNLSHLPEGACEAVCREHGEEHGDFKRAPTKPPEPFKLPSHCAPSSRQNLSRKTRMPEAPVVSARLNSLGQGKSSRDLRSSLCDAIRLMALCMLLTNVASVATCAGCYPGCYKSALRGERGVLCSLSSRERSCLRRD